MGLILASEPLLQGVGCLWGRGRSDTIGAWSTDHAQGTEEAGLVLGVGPDPGGGRLSR